jgi:hypothetical protein
MPMVGGKKYPYTEAGKKKAKKAATKLILTKKMRKDGPKKAKSSFSGANSQMGSSY